MEWNNNDEQRAQQAQHVEIPPNNFQPAGGLESIPRNADGTLDGGVPCDVGKQLASACDLMLYLECAEVFGDHKGHPVLRPGVTVAIGLDKTTQLGSVFNRYVDFCNKHSSDKLRPEILEFVHCSVLHSTDTAEAAALMKNDRIKVQKIRKKERESLSELKRFQRESDRVCFEGLRGLMQDPLGLCDIVFDCQGKLVDERGRNQEVLSTEVRGHSVVLSKRCEWLERLIQRAHEEKGRKSVVTIPEHDCGVKETPQAEEQVTLTAQRDDDGDDGIEPLQYPAVLGATEIENDEEEEAHISGPPQIASSISRCGSPVVQTPPRPNFTWVPIPNHPPNAVKLLLEFCYTNRVMALGREAFDVGSHPAQSEDGAPVPPHFSELYGGGSPRVSFAVALAGVSLAEEAKMPRLSLMCEVAASQLIESQNVVEALSTCTIQQQLTGNPLPRLRSAAMMLIFKSGHRGVNDLYRSNSFKRGLKTKSNVVVPSLLSGTMEAVLGSKQRLNAGTKRTLQHFDEFDRDDLRQRDKERRKYWDERRKEAPFMDEDDFGTQTSCRSWESPGRKSTPKNSTHVWGVGRASVAGSKQSRQQRNNRRKHGRNSS